MRIVYGMVRPEPDEPDPLLQKYPWLALWWVWEYTGQVSRV